MNEKKPVVLTFNNVVFNGTFSDNHAEVSVKSSGDMVITMEAETVAKVTEFLMAAAAEEERGAK